MNRADSSGRRKTLREEVAMAVRKRRSDRSGRGALRSPGRPSAARREDRRQFWVLIAAGRSSEDAAVGIGSTSGKKLQGVHQTGSIPIPDWFNNRRLLEPIGNIPPAEAKAAYY